MSNLIHNSTSIVSRDMNQQFKQNENEKVENNTYVYDELKWNAEPLYCPLSHPTSEGSDAKATLQDTGSTQDHKGPSFQTESQNQSLASDIASAIPIHAETTALLIVDVQPEYWSSCPSVRKDFPDFETNLARTLKTAREKRCKVIWVRANYRRETSPWLAQFERLSRNKRPDAIVELHCDPDDEEFGWEPFATPGKFCDVSVNVSVSISTLKPPVRYAVCQKNIYRCRFIIHSLNKSYLIVHCTQSCSYSFMLLHLELKHHDHALT